MPIISKIGARSWKVRAIYTLLYLVLVVGAITMVYPFALMISGSFKSDTDFYTLSPYPQYWTDDGVLFQKYVESKYNVNTALLSRAWRDQPGSWREIEIPEIDAARQRDLEDFLVWREEVDLPITWYALGHTGGGQMLPKNHRLFQDLMIEQFSGDIVRFQEEMNVYADNWTMVVCPRPFGALRRERPPAEAIQLAFRDFKAQRPVYDRVYIDLDGAFYANYVLPTYSTIENYNEIHDTDYASFEEIILHSRVPVGGRERQDWEEFVRVEMNPEFIILDGGPELDAAYQSFLRGRYPELRMLNQRHGSQWDFWEEVVCPARLPENAIHQVDWINFIAERDDDKVAEEGGRTWLFSSEFIEVYGPRQSFEEFVAERRGVSVDELRPLLLPTREADYYDTMANTQDLRWEFTTRNYKQVFNYILLQGRGIINTIIYVVLAISGALLINPLASYALSRYKPPSQYTVLLFCMATMSFPTAVVMIPSFLLLRRFPLWQVVGMIVSFFLIVWVTGLVLRQRRYENLRILIALAAATFIGFYLVPLGLERPHVSLLNTFAALVMPSLANGYFIFLLKGFFDSLPRELYEAADLDGASEWTKFWLLTMNLSKPILAVVALQAFTMAYAAFMHAVIVTPDRNMWTLMVWIYQLQSMSHAAVNFTALVIAAIPTFIMFVLCQGVIMRGIVVPTEK